MNPVRFETDPGRYRHWKLSSDGVVAKLVLDVREDGGLRPGYPLKLNSYDLGVDLELADAVERLRFEHPQVKAVIITSGKDRIFSSGANIYMLASSSHAFKVNFCKFTNETRLAIEEASRESGQRYIAALNGIASGGGYELALAADEILLVDDGNAAVALPEAPLLGVLPGTGGLTRLVDKRKVRRDRADVFSTLVEGVRGKRAKEWGLVDQVVSRSKFTELVRERALALAQSSPRAAAASDRGIALRPLPAERTEKGIAYRHLTVEFDAQRRVAEFRLKGPEGAGPETPEAIQAKGCDYWPLAVARELDDALCELRFNQERIGLVLLKTVGDPQAVLAVDRVLAANAGHWLVREVILKLGRALKRLDQTSRTFFAVIEPDSCFAGSLFELALAADRSYMLDGGQPPARVGASPLNAGLLPMANGLSRLASRFLGAPERAEEALTSGLLDAQQALELGLVTFAPDEIDWEDEVRIATEERAGFSPDAMTGMEASLRFCGPETLETKIFGRLSAWQNWVFQRPNAVGEKGALTLYGKPNRPDFDWRRT